nr:MAG TPA: hypothetical protein [Caudoviricetes sp.]
MKKLYSYNLLIFNVLQLYINYNSLIIKPKRNKEK